MKLHSWSNEYFCGRTKEFFEEKKQINVEEYLKVAAYKKCLECGQLVTGHPEEEKEKANKRCCWFVPAMGGSTVTGGK